MTIRFDDAWLAAIRVAREVSGDGRRVVLVRDLIGRASLILDDNDSILSSEEMTQLEGRIREGAGSFAGSNPILLASELVNPAEFFDAPDALNADDSDPDRLIILERGVVGSQWAQVAEDATRRRVTLYGFKGGVGRSTAAFMLARHLAAEGLCVLVADLDLESPGIGALLQTPEDLPDFGIVDVMSEAAVGNPADFDFVVRSTVDPVPGNGEIWLAPAGGRDRPGYTYLPKLNRIYLDLVSPGNPNKVVPFSERLDQTLIACEDEVARLSRRPDVVLLDSRAGIHDIAAAAISQLSDLSLLFAGNSAQTWSGYRMLFSQWARSPEMARRIRDRLKMVAAMVPHETSEAYLRSFRDVAQLHLSETLYDDVEGGDASGYNPSPSDSGAPHYPLPILFSRDLTGLDAVARPGWHSSELVVTAYRQFLEGAADLILQGTGA